MSTLHEPGTAFPRPDAGLRRDTGGTPFPPDDGRDSESLVLRGAPSPCPPQASLLRVRFTSMHGTTHVADMTVDEVLLWKQGASAIRRHVMFEAAYLALTRMQALPESTSLADFYAECDGREWEALKFEDMTTAPANRAERRAQRKRSRKG
jgi:hypothetical protein